jgi:FMN phosphatase YigB (HAD superfamily)
MISFVYFDVGGVAIKDFSASNKWEEMERDLGITQLTLSTFKKFWDDHTKRIELDQDLDDLVPLLRAELNLKLPNNYSWLDDFIERFEPNYSLWPIIQKIKETMSVGLLTNMYPRMFKAIQGSGLLPPISWDAIIDSSIELVKKPNPKIYMLAEERAVFPASEILFVDNHQENLDTADSLGWQTFLYDSNDYEQSSKQLENFVKGGGKIPPPLIE